MYETKIREQQVFHLSKSGSLSSKVITFIVLICLCTSVAYLYKLNQKLTEKIEAQNKLISKLAERQTSLENVFILDNPQKFAESDVSMTEHSKGDFTKVIVKEHSQQPSENSTYRIGCTLQNNDTRWHSVIIQVIYQDKDLVPVLVKKQLVGVINPNEIREVIIEQSEMINEIVSYELQLLSNDENPNAIIKLSN